MWNNLYFSNQCSKQATQSWSFAASISHNHHTESQIARKTIPGHFFYNVCNVLHQMKKVLNLYHVPSFLPSSDQHTDFACSFLFQSLALSCRQIKS